LALYFTWFSTKVFTIFVDQTDGPISPPAQPPVLAAAPPVIASPAAKPAGGSSSWRKAVAVLMSLLLWLFLANGIVSVLDDVCVLGLGRHVFSGINGLVEFLLLPVMVLSYGLVGLTPVVPKRVVVPLVAFTLLTMLAALPVITFWYGQLVLFDLICSFLVALLALWIIHRLNGGWKTGWWPVSEKHLGTRSFSWKNLSLFVLINVFVVAPVSLAFVAGCASVAVNHFTEGFMSLRPGGLYVQARKYARDDGKTVLLFPMAHIAESDFYRNVTQTVSSNSVVLLEGVTDEKNLLVHGISYKRAAKTLHLAEQHEVFKPKQGDLVHADVDVSEFSSNTIVALNLVALIHVQGLNLQTLSALLAYTPTEEMEQQLFGDLLLRRNQHVIQVLQSRLADADSFVIPWGAAHMPGLSHEIEKAGFHVVETRDFVTIRFGGKAKSDAVGGWIRATGSSN
jgi:hypothetical protein